MIQRHETQEMQEEHEQALYITGKKPQSNDTEWPTRWPYCRKASLCVLTPQGNNEQPFLNCSSLR